MKTKVIYKYEIHLLPEFEIEMPIHTEILSFQRQGNLMFIWVACDQSDRLIKYKFILKPTGAEVPALCSYIGTVVDHENMVWHLYFDIIETSMLSREHSA